MNITNRIGEDAAALALVETGLGSALHALRFPLTGQLLSANQAFFLGRSARAIPAPRQASTAPFLISLIAAILKSLSPAGPTLTPMLAISMQGFLFSIGTYTLGPGMAGIVFGSLLLSPWAIVQPILLLTLFFGRNIFTAAEFSLQRLHHLLPFVSANLVHFILIVFIVRAFVCMAAGFAVFLVSDQRATQFRARLLSMSRKKSTHIPELSILHSVLRDLSQPFFIFSLALTTIFFCFSESPLSGLIWILLRPLALGFIFFYLVRRISLTPLLTLLKQWQFHQLAGSLEHAARTIENLK